MGRIHAVRSAFRRGRSQAMPIAGRRRRGPGPRARVWLGWLAAVAGVAIVAFLVGRAGSEVEIASPTPSPSAAPLSITFGTALDKVTGEAIQPTDRFRADERISYSVRLATALGVDHVFVEIVRLDSPKGTVVQAPSRQGIVATSRIVAFTFARPTTTLLEKWGPGDYEMRIALPNATVPFATGRFTLVETPVASCTAGHGDRSCARSPIPIPPASELVPPAWRLRGCPDQLSATQPNCTGPHMSILT